MRCPTCSHSTPIGRSTCTQCGALLTMRILTDPKAAAPSPAPTTPPSQPTERVAEPPAPERPTWVVPVLCVAAGLSVLLAAITIHAGIGGSSQEGTQVSVGTAAPTTAGAPIGGSDQVPSTDGGGSPATDASGQAGAVNEVLESSATSRSELPADLQSCDGVSDAVEPLRQIVSEREGQVTRAKALAVDQLEGGDELRSYLVTALEASLRADRAYLAWARNVQGCTGDAPMDDSDHAEAAQADEDAGDAKDRVVSDWQPIAAQFGLPTYSDGQI
jgi:hypothetical protein